MKKIIISLFCFLQFLQINAQISQKIDTTKEYNEKISQQLKGTLQNWGKHIVNYSLKDISVWGKTKIADSIALEKYYNLIIDTSGLCPLYSNNTKEVSFGSLGQALFINTNSSSDTSMYDRYKHMVKDSIAIGDNILNASFTLINNNNNTPLIINELIIYSNSNGLKFDNILWFISPMEVNFSMQKQ